MSVCMWNLLCYYSVPTWSLHKTVVRGSVTAAWYGGYVSCVVFNVLAGTDGASRSSFWATPRKDPRYAFCICSAALASCTSQFHAVVWDSHILSIVLANVKEYKLPGLKPCWSGLRKLPSHGSGKSSWPFTIRGPKALVSLFSWHLVIPLKEFLFVTSAVLKSHFVPAVTLPAALKHPVYVPLWSSMRNSFLGSLLDPGKTVSHNTQTGPLHVVATCCYAGTMFCGHRYWHSRCIKLDFTEARDDL